MGTNSVGSMIKKEKLEDPGTYEIDHGKPTIDTK